MKKLLIILILLAPILTWGQAVVQQSRTPSSGATAGNSFFQWYSGLFGGYLVAPNGNTAVINRQTGIEGQIFVQWADTTLRAWHGGQFVPISGGGSTGAIVFTNAFKGLGTSVSPIDLNLDTLNTTRMYYIGYDPVTKGLRYDTTGISIDTTVFVRKLPNGDVYIDGRLYPLMGFVSDSASYINTTGGVGLTINQSDGASFGLRVNGQTYFNGQSEFTQFVQYDADAAYKQNIEFGSTISDNHGIQVNIGNASTNYYNLKFSTTDSLWHTYNTYTGAFPTHNNAIATLGDIAASGITLTTTGSSGASTLIGGVLNIPVYSGASYSAGNGLSLSGTTFKADTAILQTILNFFPKGDTRYLQSSTAGTTYVPLTRTLTGGIGVNTIGDLSANRTISLDTTSTVVTKTFGGRYVTTNSAASLASLTVTGTGGAGFFDMVAQSSPPSTPVVNHQHIYADASGRFTIMGSNGFGLSISKSLLTATRVILAPDSAGTVALENRIIPNASLANSAITINGTPVSLGASTTVTASTTAALTMNNGGAGDASGTTFNGGTARILSYNTLGAAPLASPSFTGTVTIPTPFTLGATSVTSTGTQLNYLNAATGTTGTTSTNVVYSTSPTLVTPILGTPTSVTLTNGTGLPLTTGVTGVLPYANGGTNASTSWTQGSVIFGGASAYAQDNSNFFYDGTNHRLGLITAAPTHSLTLGTGGNVAIYNTSDQTTNYERLSMSWSANLFSFVTQAGGTGVGRNFAIGTPTRQMVMYETANTSTGFYQNATGTSLANAVGTTIQGTWNPSSGVSKIFEIAPTINETSTSGYTALWISPFEQAVGSGNTYLIDAGTNSSGSAGGTHTPKFTVFSNGNTAVTGTLTVTGTTTMNGNIASSSSGSTSNFFTNGSSIGLINTTAAATLVDGATNMSGRVLINGTTNGSLTASNSYGGLIIGGQPLTTANSGTNALIANAIIRSPTITVTGGSTVTDAASLYVQGGTSGATNTWNSWLKYKVTRVSGLQLDTLTASKVMFTDANKQATSTGIGTSTQFIMGDGSLASTARIAYAHNISTPTTGGTVNLTNNQYNIINPAGALVALTINLPSSPANNDVVMIKYTQAVTTVTYTGGTVVDSIASPASGAYLVLTYDSGTTSWY